MSWNPAVFVQGNEAKKVRWNIVPFTRGYGLDLGCGQFKPFTHMLGVDWFCQTCNRNKWHQSGCPNTASIDLIHIADKLPLFSSQSLDFVFSSFLLQDVANPQDTLEEWWRLLKPKGHLVLYLPDAAQVPVHPHGQTSGKPLFKHRFRPKDVIAWMKELSPGWDLMVSEVHDNDQEYGFLQVFRKRNDKEVSYPCYEARPEKSCVVVRYGGIGDMIMASSFLPQLKAKGYHVTFNTTPAGYQVISNDPHIDSWLIQDDDQVPNHELGDYVEYLRTKYNRVINLCESVEVRLLAVKSKPEFHFSKEARHKLMDFNYLEVQHDIAGMPYKPSPKFYPTEREARIAEKERRAIPGKLLLWTQAGSSVHKFWPHQDTAIARILLHYPDWHVALTGDNVCRLLEMGWEKTPRIIELSGKIGVRQTLALAEVADMVVGPETGVLNAVSHLQVPKIVFLSHSSVTNLTRDWINTIPLEAHGCLCYPCHQMHTDGWKDCPKGPNGTGAWCQEQISPEAFMDAFEKQARLLTKGAGG